MQTSGDDDFRELQIMVLSRVLLLLLMARGVATSAVFAERDLIAEVNAAGTSPQTNCNSGLSVVRVELPPRPVTGMGVARIERKFPENGEGPYVFPLPAGVDIPLLLQTAEVQNAQIAVKLHLGAPRLVVTPVDKRAVGSVITAEPLGDFEVLQTVRVGNVGKGGVTSTTIQDTYVVRNGSEEQWPEQTELKFANGVSINPASTIESGTSASVTTEMCAEISIKLKIAAADLSAVSVKHVPLALMARLCGKWNDGLVSEGGMRVVITADNKTTEYRLSAADAKNLRVGNETVIAADSGIVAKVDSHDDSCFKLSDTTLTFQRLRHLKLADAPRWPIEFNKDLISVTCGNQLHVSQSQEMELIPPAFASVQELMSYRDALDSLSDDDLKDAPEIVRSIKQLVDEQVKTIEDSITDESNASKQLSTVAFETPDLLPLVRRDRLNCLYDEIDAAKAKRAVAIHRLSSAVCSILRSQAATEATAAIEPATSVPPAREPAATNPVDALSPENG